MRMTILTWKETLRILEEAQLDLPLTDENAEVHLMT